MQISHGMHGKRNKEDLDLEPYAITNEHGFIRQRDAHDDFGYNEIDYGQKSV